MSLLYNYYIQRPVVGIRLALMNINEMQGMRSGLHTRVSLEAASSSAISMYVLFDANEYLLGCPFAH